MKPRLVCAVFSSALAAVLAGALGGVQAAAAAAGLHVVASPFITNSCLSGAAVIGSSDMWAVGDSGTGLGCNPFQIVGQGGGPFQTLAEHFDGTSWSAVPTPALNAAFSGVAGSAGNDVWAVGDQAQGSSNNTLIEHFNGTSWTVVPSPNPNPQGNNGLVAVAAVSASDVWAVGHQLLGPFTEHWNGKSWDIVNTPAGVSFFGAMAASSVGTVLAVGQGTNSSGIILSN